MSADKKDYESICAQYGVTDFRGMLKKLNERKIEREYEQQRVCFSLLKVTSTITWINAIIQVQTLKHNYSWFQLIQVVERLCNLKPIALKDDGDAEFELEMSLKDPSSKIFLFKVRCLIWNILVFVLQVN